MDHCLEFLVKIGNAISTSIIPDDTLVQSAIKFSGRQSNDQGDISSCIKDNLMNFVELAMSQQQQKVYRGLCLPVYCNANWMNENKQALVELLQSKNISVTAQSLVFTQYPESSSSIYSNSVGFILITILIVCMLLLMLLSYITLKYFQYKKSNSQFHNPNDLDIAISRKTSCIQLKRKQDVQIKDLEIISKLSLINKLIDDKDKKNSSENSLEQIIQENQGEQSISQESLDKQKPQDKYIEDIDQHSFDVQNLFEQQDLQNNDDIEIISRLNPEQKLYDKKNQFQISFAENQIQQQYEQEGEEEEINKTNIVFRIIECWDINDNLKRLCTLKTSDPDLMCFNCIRVISFLQVILGHEFFLHVTYVSNPTDISIVSKQPFTLFILSCLYSVDVFFFLGGFFVSFVFINPKYLSLFKIKRYFRVIKTLFAAIFNRVIRILPSYFFALLLFWQYTSFLGNSPTWNEFKESASQCDNGWWKKLLFIDNLFDDGQLCFGWGWYLSNDMQMFIFSLILLIIYANNKFFGKVTIFSSFFIFQSFSIYTSFSNNYLIVSSLKTLPNYKFYFKPWNRCPPYLIGLIFGMLYKEYTLEKSKDLKTSFISMFQKRVKNTMLKWALYANGIAIIFFLILGPRSLQIYGSSYWPDGVQNFWFGTCRTFYVIGIILILIPGMCGSQDLFVRIMSSKIFQMLAKFCFQGYLVHFIVLSYALWSFKDAMYLKLENVIWLFLCETVLTIGISFVIILLVESPFYNITNIIFNLKTSKQQSSPKELYKSQSQQNTENQTKQFIQSQNKYNRIFDNQ